MNFLEKREQGRGNGECSAPVLPRRRHALFPVPLSPRNARAFGFTLLEMLAVIVLLGIVAVIVARSVSGRVDTGKWKAGTIGVTKLDQDVQAYALDNGSPPKSLDDLITKPLNAPSWNGPYAKPADLKDPFGHPYGYVYPGKHGQYDIVFLGRDGKPNGEGVDRDYGNWQ
jgi:general secretion pathway protein G